MPPRSVAFRDDRPPPSLPTGVRAVPRMTVLGMGLTIASADARPGHHRRPAGHRAPTRSSSACSTARASRTTSRTARSARSWSPARRARSSARSPMRTPPGGAGSWSAAASARRSTPSARGSRRPPRSAARASWARGRCAGSCPHKVGDDVPGALVEGTLLAAYRYTAFKSDPGEDRAPEALVVSAHHDVSAAGRAGPRRRRGRQPRARPRQRAAERAHAARARRTRPGAARRAGRRDGPGGHRGGGDGRVRRASRRARARSRS